MVNQKLETVVVGMSGGVDSAVTALLLKQQGYNVIGMFMKNWEEKNSEGVCQSANDYEDVARVCDKIGIPYYSVNFAKEYWDNVFAHCLEEFKKGNTPNPDVLCNREIKFKVLYDRAMELGGDYLATGHYCRVGHSNGGAQLLKGLDPNKDQSYFLHMVKEETLKKVLFPIGEIIKSDVRDIARKYELPVSEKKDSTGICFIGERKFRDFLGQYIPRQPGNFENTQGDVIGRHDGIAFYTVGQRRGLGIGGPGDAWFVVNKDVSRNVVIIEQGENHPALFSSSLKANDFSWVSSNGAPKLPHACSSKIRYRQADQDCVIEEIVDGVATVTFPTPQRAVTPHQSIVFYDGDVCLGGGIIN
jgi:tRNA-specific 2-thiouridylase